MNTTCIKQIKPLYQASNNSKNTHLKGINEFLETELEVGQVEAADFSRRGKRLLKNLAQVAREAHSVPVC